MFIQKQLSIIFTLVWLLFGGTCLAQEFTVGPYRAFSVLGKPQIMDGVDYISFAGDFGLAGWIPKTEAISRHISLESELLSNFQLSVINLEHMLPGSSGQALDKQIDDVMVNILTKSGYDLIALANNHALDYGSEGLRYNTLYLEKVGLNMIGIRSHPVYVWERNDYRMAIVALTEYIDLEDPQNQILRIKQSDLRIIKQLPNVDVRIAFVHLGSMSAFPSPHEKEQAKRLFEAGADLIVCTGAHFVKGFSFVEGKPVAYGLGNHLFRSPIRDAEPIGIHLVAGFQAGQLVQIFVIPFFTRADVGEIGLLNEAQFSSFQSTFRERSTSDPEKYFSDPRSINTIIDRVRSWRWGSFRALRWRHVEYAAHIIFSHYPVTTLIIGITLITLPILVFRSRIFRSKS